MEAMLQTVFFSSMTVRFFENSEAFLQKVFLYP